jgi:hypothetical protein
MNGVNKSFLNDITRMCRRLLLQLQIWPDSFQLIVPDVFIIKQKKLYSVCHYFYSGPAGQFQYCTDQKSKLKF